VTEKLTIYSRAYGCPQYIIALGMNAETIAHITNAHITNASITKLTDDRYHLNIYNLIETLSNETNLRMGCCTVCTVYNTCTSSQTINESVVDSDRYLDKSSHIDGLYIEEGYRRRGLGLILLKYVLNDLYEQGTRYVELEDVSDWVGQKNCIYRKAGLHYVSDDNAMRGNLRHILHGCRGNK